MTNCCKGCGQELFDGGSVGLFCGNKSCDYERVQSMKYYRLMQEAKEIKELARLKAKYENGDQ